MHTYVIPFPNSVFKNSLLDVEPINNRHTYCVQSAGFGHIETVDINDPIMQINVLTYPKVQRGLVVRALTHMRCTSAYVFKVTALH